HKVFHVRNSKLNFNGLSTDRWTTSETVPQRLSHRSVHGSDGVLKRVIDVCGAAFGLIVLSPLLFVVAAAIKISDGGPVFYKQIRVGLNGASFVIFKFRTMHDGAERDLGPVWSVPRDPRCTRLGGVLRRLGIDELPQLWNVLRGEMSLVGPRP